MGLSIINQCTEAVARLQEILAMGVPVKNASIAGISCIPTFGLQKKNLGKNLTICILGLKLDLGMFIHHI